MRLKFNILMETLIGSQDLENPAIFLSALFIVIWKRMSGFCVLCTSTELIASSPVSQQCRWQCTTACAFASHLQALFPHESPSKSLSNICAPPLLRCFVVISRDFPVAIPLLAVANASHSWRCLMISAISIASRVCAFLLVITSAALLSYIP